MAAATAHDIRAVARHVRAAAETIPPYRRTVPYDFEVFEPLMKMLPKEPLPYEPRPQRPGETDYEYTQAWRRHHTLLSLQRIDEYFKAKGGRLPSPSSDIDDDDDVRAHSALWDQEYVLRGLDIVEREFFNEPMVFEGNPEEPPGWYERRLREILGGELSNKPSEDTDISRGGNGDMPSSSSSTQEPGRLSGIIRKSIEDEAGPAAEQQETDGSVVYPSIERSPERPQSDNETEASIPSSLQVSEPTLTRKRRSLPAEDDTLESPSKRKRTDKHPQLSTASSTAGHKRKRDEQEASDKLSSTGEPQQPSDKKRRLDVERKILPSQKRKRGFEDDDEELQVSQLGRGVPETKRRRIPSAQGASAAAGSRAPLATASPLRITRARRQQLSGEDSQLLQLDQRGKPDVQKPKPAARESAQDPPVTDRNGRRPKKTAGINVQNSGKTPTTNTTKTNAKASTKVGATTKIIAKTRSYSDSSKYRRKGQLSST